MAQMRITETQANELLKARDLDRFSRKNAKRRIFSQIRRDHNLPYSKKIKLFVENSDNPLYLVIRDKRTGMPLDDGKPEVRPVEPVQVALEVKPLVTLVPKAKKPAVKKAAPAKKPVAKKATPAKKAGVKKPVAKKVAPAKKGTSVKKAAPAKKPAMKAVVKKVTAKKPVAKKTTSKK